MKIKTRTKHDDQLYEPKDGDRYIIILHDGRKVKGQWSTVGSRFYLDEARAIFVLRQEAFDWWPENV